MPVPRSPTLGLVHLKGLTKLQAFKIGGFGQEITDAGVADLQKALPNCKIYRSSRRHRRPTARPTR